MEMKEIIAPASVEKMLLFLAVAGPLVGLIIGTIIGAHEEQSWRKIVAGTLIGALGTLTWGMWHVYGAITNALGLDSVANLGLQLIMFAVLGAVLGAASFRLRLMLMRAQQKKSGD
ncbi:MAG: hypothetical protein M1133_02345 [Armatimonadetes bacterium]|nr:hypothetical protein [Armatimonadota bacterium]